MAEGRKLSISAEIGRSRRASGLQIPPVAAPGAPPIDVASTEGRSTTDISSGRRGEFRKSRTAATTVEKRAPSRESPIDTESPSLVEKMTAMELLSTATCPGYGSLGRKYRMYVNHFEMRVKIVTICHYHVEITSSILNLRLTRDDNRPILWQCLLQNSQELGLSREDMYKLAYDDVSNLYSLNPLTLPRDNLKRFDIELLITRFDRPVKFNVLVQIVGPVIMDLQQAVSSAPGSKVLTPVQILDIIVRQYRSNPLLETSKIFYPFGPTVYMIPGFAGAPAAVDLLCGREIWRGLFTSVHVGQHSKIFVNMDTSHTAFYKQNVNGNSVRYSCIMFLCDVLNFADRADSNVYRPEQLTDRTSLNDVVIQVFQREIEGLKVCKDYSDFQTRQYVVLGVDKPPIHISFTDKDGNEHTVADYFTRIVGPLRFPLMPTLKVGCAKKMIHFPIECSVREGVWRAGNTKLLLPADIKGLAAVAFQPTGNLRDARGFLGKLLQVCQQAGIQIPDPNSIYFHLENDSSAQRVEIALQNVSNAMKSRHLELSLIIVFLPLKRSPLYAEVKRVAEIQMGIMTQCIANKTVDKCTPDVLSNIIYKINMKLGGVNCELDVRENLTRVLFQEPTLVLGIDVTHPGPTDKRSPSIASVVGSMDKTCMRYAASIKVQKQRRETLVYLSEPFTERLMYFFKSTKVKPSRIIIFRDGVSEGEFQSILREELRAIRESCLKVDINFKPKITFIVVQKRHHTRFFPKNPDDGCGRVKNVYPGTVVDTDVLFDTDFNFYLCSHFGIQGTSRPARYHVLYDENKFSSDNMQYLAYFLCHCYSRCTRAVSIPAPLYFAHLACARARAHLVNLVGEEFAESSSTEQSSSIPEEQLIRGSTVTDSILSSA